MTITIDTLRHKLQQLQALHDSGALSAEAFAEARVPLERELVALVMQGEAALPPAAGQPAPLSASPRPSRGLQASLLVGILALALIGYAWTGSPRRALLGPSVAEDAAQIAAGAPGGASSPDGNPAFTAEQVNAMVQKLAERLKQKPDDALGWTMLARAYSAMGRFSDAVPAFQKALALAGDNASLLTDYADALASQNGNQLTGEPITLVRRALALEPNNLKALALSGSAAFDQRDYATAARQWEQVERALPADSAFLTQVRASIAQARQLGGLAPSASSTAQTPVAAGSAAPGAPGSAGGAPAVALASALSGTVSLAPALVAQAAPTDTVFIVARAASGPRMPLAVLRKQVKDLPLRFTLDDSMAMTPTARISDQPQVIVIARISKSGNAIPQPGDLSGQSAPVAPGTTDIAVEIRQTVAP